jgi:Fur family zinc uptake transcriptional regulator
VHRIASLNAFVGCSRPHTDHVGHFMICGTCKESAEISDKRLEDVIRDTASDAGFDVRRQTVEMLGTCTRCRCEPAPADPEPCKTVSSRNRKAVP